MLWIEQGDGDGQEHGEGYGEITRHTALIPARCAHPIGGQDYTRVPRYTLDAAGTVRPAGKPHVHREDKEGLEIEGIPGQELLHGTAGMVPGPRWRRLLDGTGIQDRGNTVYGVTAIGGPTGLVPMTFVDSRGRPGTTVSGRWPTLRGRSVGPG